jgi:hypothetical protein
MRFAAHEFVPEEAKFESYLEEMRQYVRIAGIRPPGEILEEFFEFPVSAREHHIEGVHHVAFYAGDYRTDAEVEGWLEFLRQSRSVSDLEYGPSYILPREYGTQGYWISCRLDKMAVEMFYSKNAGPWREHGQQYKIARMSHFALSVPQAFHLFPLLRYFAHYPDISVLSYSKEDVLGHTYGHLLNGKTDCVLELTHSQQPGIASRGAMGADSYAGQEGVYG